MEGYLEFVWEVGVIGAMIINKNYSVYGIFAGIAIAALVISLKNKKDEEK